MSPNPHIDAQARENQGNSIIRIRDDPNQGQRLLSLFAWDLLNMPEGFKEGEDVRVKSVALR